MSGHSILVIEDNPVTRKMMRVALQSDGFHVVEAGDGRSALAAAAEHRPDLIILDYVLPDTDGRRLIDDLRRQAGAPDIPALVVTGMVSRLPELRAQGGHLTQFLPKPIEVSRLIQVARAHLTPPERLGGGRTVLVVDDDPLNLKLAALRLGAEGYVVETAQGGAEALLQARALPPNAILAQAGMVAMNGFALCREVRRDPRLADIPFVLYSAHVEEGDRLLARDLGANALVTHGADLRDAAAALHESLGRTAPPPGTAAGERRQASAVEGAGEAELPALYRERVQVQLERQAAQNRALLRQAGIQATALALMRSLSEVLGKPGSNMPEIIGDVLVQCLDAAGLSTGLLYLVEPGERYRLQAQCGILEALRQEAETCFGHPDLIRAIVRSGRPCALSAATVEHPGTDDLLARLGRACVLVVPFVVMGETFGFLMLASDNQDLSEGSWIAFAASLAVQFGQTVALGQSLTRLAASEERYRALMEQANDAILVLEPPQRILEANRAAERLLGRPRQEIVGRHYDEFVLAEERPESARSRETLLQQGMVRVQTRQFTHADGTLLPVEVSCSLVRVGQETTILVILHDLSERRLLEAQFLQAQKMESVGRLAGVVAHDFNNLLTVILGYGSLLQQALADRPALERQVDSIIRAGESAAALTRQLLAFSRRQLLVPRVLDLNALIRQLEPMLRRLIGEEVELTADLDPRLRHILADAGQLEQVIMNLMVNARDAMPGGGIITLSTRNGAPEPAAGGAAAPAEAAAPVVLAVTDTGTGMDSSVLEHIFEPFFTTKEEGKGTGLGLASVYGIVHQSGGRIEVDSRPGQGTTFAIHLPGTDHPVAAAQAVEAAPGRGHETILVAEDEAEIRALARDVLESRGYQVIEAAGAGEALLAAERHGGTIHLLLTDVIMPGKGGVELAEALRARRPGLRVVFMSGYSDRPVPAEALGVAFLHKPFDPDDLAHQVRATLDQR